MWERSFWWWGEGRFLPKRTRLSFTQWKIDGPPMNAVFSRSQISKINPVVSLQHFKPKTTGRPARLASTFVCERNFSHMHPPVIIDFVKIVLGLVFGF
jgi:hypothetical protein